VAPLEGTSRIERFQELSGRLARVLEAVSPDDDNPGSIVRYYFSGLGDVREEIAEIHGMTDWEINELADAAPEEYPLLKPERLRALATTRVFLPSRAEWAQFTRDVFDMRVPYLVLRLLLLRRDWREVATVYYKCHFCAQMLAEY
jgi:hypothetical protein